MISELYIGRNLIMMFVTNFSTLSDNVTMGSKGSNSIMFLIDALINSLKF